MGSKRIEWSGKDSFKLRPQRQQGIHLARGRNWNIPGRERSTCKGDVLGRSFACSKNRKRICLRDWNAASCGELRDEARQTDRQDPSRQALCSGALGPELFQGQHRRVWSKEVTGSGSLYQKVTSGWRMECRGGKTGVRGTTWRLFQQ